MRKNRKVCLECSEYESKCMCGGSIKGREMRLTEKEMKELTQNMIMINPWVIAEAQFTKTAELTRKELGRGEGSPKIICLCGSSRFIESFAVLAWEFEKEGHITLGLHYLPPSYSTKVPDHIAEAEGVSRQMDELHLRKIDLADEVFVINVNGYIGESTAREIKYAEGLGKPVKYLEALKGS